jgi:hypothetical protein
MDCGSLLCRDQRCLLLCSDHWHFTLVQNSPLVVVEVCLLGFTLQKLKEKKVSITPLVWRFKRLHLTKNSRRNYDSNFPLNACIWLINAVALKARIVEPEEMGWENRIMYFWLRWIRGPPLWSSGQSSWLQIRRPGFDSRHYQIF